MKKTENTDYTNLQIGLAVAAIVLLYILNPLINEDIKQTESTHFLKKALVQCSSSETCTQKVRENHNKCFTDATKKGSNKSTYFFDWDQYIECVKK